ncbi:hypothetical protein RI367_005223 [Sorochytrium milnesiophthora]
MAQSSTAQALLASLPSRAAIAAYAEANSVSVSRVIADRALPYIDASIYDLPDASQDVWRKDTDHVLCLREMLRQSDDYLSLVYGYRGCAKALPQLPPTADDKTKTEFNKRVFELIRPEIAKMKQLMTFCDTAVSTLVNVIAQLAPVYKNQQSASDDLLYHIAQSLDTFLVLDALKNMKSSLNNDFSMMYKRAIAVVMREGLLQEDETAENHNLYLFLANHDRFSFTLKDKLSKLPAGYDEVLIDIVNLCVDRFEKSNFTWPSEKHSLLKAATFAMALMDQPGDDKDVHKKKRLKLERFGRLIKAHPVVPLFGDMPIALAKLLARTPHLDGKWDLSKSEETQLAISYSVLAKLPNMRKEYSQYLTVLQLMLDTVQMSAEPGRKPESMEDKNRRCYRVLLKGLHVLSMLSSAVLEQNAWKFAYQTDHSRNPDCPETALNYEKAIRYNYSSEERFALIEFITMIKTLSSCLIKAEARLEQYMRAHIYSEVQAFVRGPLDSMFTHTAKKKKAISSILKHVQEILQDQSASSASSPALLDAVGNKSFKRVVVPIVTQLYFARSLLQSVSDERAAGMKGGFMKEKDLKDNQVQEINAFLDMSYDYPQLLDYAACVTKCSDLSGLWYKEFYLELSKQIQFPIEMSLPWILTNHLLQSSAADISDSILFPISIYNDAAWNALYGLKLKYLYDEIEAEANLAVDMFVTKYAEKLLRHYKVMASSHILSERYKTKILEGTVTADKNYDAPLDRQRLIVRQHTVQLLGRFIDLHKLLAEHLNYHFRRSIEAAVAKYEGADITGIMELQTLLEVTRHAHRLAAQDLDLDNIDDMIAEVDESHYHHALGRIYAHTVSELCGDFLTQFAYNHLTQRFVYGATSLVPPVQRASAPRVKHHYLYGNKHHLAAHEAQLQLYEHFVGVIHFRAIVSVLGVDRTYALVAEVVDTADTLVLPFLRSEESELTFWTQIKEGVTPYTWALSKGFPPTLKLPGIDYGTKGTFEYVQALLKPLLVYKDLEQVFEVFRELGNALLVVKRLESALVPSHALLLKQTVQPSIMDLILRRLYATIREAHPLWMDSEGPEGNPVAEDPFAYESSREFYRIFSFLQFAFCLPTVDANGKRHREVFGDSVHWAGYLILNALSQVELFTTFDFTWHACYVASLNMDKEKDKKAATPAAQKSLEDMSRFIAQGDFYRSMCTGIQQYFGQMEKKLK